MYLSHLYQKPGAHTFISVLVEDEDGNTSRGAYNSSQSAAVEAIVPPEVFAEVSALWTDEPAWVDPPDHP